MTAVLKRRLALGLALLVVAAAALHASDPDGEVMPTPAATADLRAPSRAGAPPRQEASEPLPRLQIDRLDALGEQRRSVHPANDPFAVAVSREQRAAASTAAAQAAPVPPPPPQAPAIPFRFLGAQDADGVQLVFLEQQNRTHIARPGEEIADGWRLDRLTERSVIFTYVPLGQQRTLQIGGVS